MMQMKIQIFEGVNEQTFDMSYLAKGVYFIKFKDSEGERVERIIRE